MYVELIVFPHALRGTQIFSEQARSIVAKACHESNVNPEIFNRRKEDGKSIQRVFGHTADGEGYGAIPSIVFGGGKGFVRIIGFGKKGTKLLSENASTISTAVSQMYDNSPYRFDMKSGNCTIDHPDGSTFKIHNLIVTKKREHYSDIAQNGIPSLESMTHLIEKAIIRGLIGQALTIDEETGSNCAGAIKTDKGMGIKIFAGTPVFIPIKEGTKKCALGVHKLEFTMNCGISGPWFVGHLRSRGFGQILKGRVTT